MGKRKGKDRTGGRNADGSVSQGVEAGDPRERKLRELAAGVVWDGDRRGPGALALAAEDLVPEQRGFVVVIRNFFTPSECQQWRAIVEQVGLNPASAADLRPRKNEAFLNRESLACPCDVLYDGTTVAKERTGASELKEATYGGWPAAGMCARALGGRDRLIGVRRERESRDM